MGYLFVALALLSGGIKSFCGKKISGKTPTIKNAILTNFVRMLFCIIFGFLFVLVIDGVGALKMDGMAILLALGGSIATCVFLVSWLLAMRKNAYMTVEAFVLVSMLVPVLLKLLLYGEKVDLFQWIGLAILIFAVVLMSIYNNQTKGKLTAVGVLLLLVVCLGNGLNSFTQNVFKTEFSLLSAAAFNFYVYVFSAALLGITFLCLKEKPTAEEESAKQVGEDLEKKEPLFDRTKLILIAIMAVFLFCNSYFITLANGYLPAVQLNPLLNVSALLVGLFISVVFFKEKLKAVSIIGISLMVVGVIFINVLSVLL